MVGINGKRVQFNYPHCQKRIWDPFGYSQVLSMVPWFRKIQCHNLHCKHVGNYSTYIRFAYFIGNLALKSVPDHFNFHNFFIGGPFFIYLVSLLFGGPF